MTSRRFGEFQRGLGSAENILAARLRALEQAGVLHGGPAPDGGPHREFVLTDEGRAVFPVTVVLRRWGGEQRFTLGERPLPAAGPPDRQPAGPGEGRSAAS
ncbi:winged helix-turn-helix transcriptional regulator [Streptomyces olivaceoviridis]|uniref:winged helix-turn-helix transcriptional regulator n=1 Tax=Streptomyces olivaceoviridis TaxID=1921 RepID=UPI003F4C8F15